MLKRLAAALALTAAVHAAPAHANQYEVFVDIDTEEDLYDLRVANQIDDDTFQTLLELYQRGVDLNTADRSELYELPNLTYSEVDAILAYREEVGQIADPAGLVANGVLSQEKLESIAAFLVVDDPTATALAASGWARYQTRWSAEDEAAPPMALQARVETFKHVRAGVAVLVGRARLGDVRYDPTRQALTAEAPELTPRVPKGYVQWSDGDLSVVAGTYRIGFGQRLTFDNTNQTDPRGFYGDEEIFRDSTLVRECKETAGELESSPCAGDPGNVYVSPDFRWRDALLGVAAGIEALEVSAGHVSAHAFTSYQPRSIYQYEIYDRGVCDDPRNDGDPNCSAPEVFRTADDPFMPASRFTFHTLPNMFAEATAGGNLTYSPRRRTHVGITGYGSHIDWLVEGIDLDFQEWSRTPFGGDFGAVGVNAAHGVGITDFFAEVTRSFDSMPDGGGGFGAILRSVTSWGKNEVEGSLRYYDQDFANPHARPISAADELDGLRARDEAGGRVRYSGTLRKRLNLRSSFDLWRSLRDERTAVLTYVRGDVDITDQLRWGLWAQYQDKGLGTGGRDQCFEVSIETDERGERIPCAGEKLQLTGRVRLAPHKAYWVDLQYQHELLDDGRYDDDLRQDASAIAILTAKPNDRLRLRARTRYLFEDISDNQYLEQSLWAYADASYRLRHRDRLRLRYDLVVYLDDRASTATRTPSPEQWLWLEYESKF